MLYYWALNWRRALLNFSKSEIQICTWRLGRSLISIPEAEIACSGWSQESLAVPSVSTESFELIQAKVVKYKVENILLQAFLEPIHDGNCCVYTCREEDPSWCTMSGG